MAQEYSLFQNSCAECGKTIMTPMDKGRRLPLVFCVDRGGVCETLYNQKNKMVDRKEFVPFRKPMGTGELTQKMASQPWRPNNGGQYILKSQEETIREEIPV